MLDEIAGGDARVEGARVFHFFVPRLVDSSTDELLVASIGGKKEAWSEILESQAQDLVWRKDGINAVMSGSKAAIFPCGRKEAR